MMSAIKAEWKTLYTMIRTKATRNKKKKEKEKGTVYNSVLPSYNSFETNELE